jgi:adenylylsulfate kinase
MNRKGATVWFTGLPSSGKSTIARLVHQQLLDRRCLVELLDGSEIRESLSRGLTFSREDREEHVRRIGYVAKLLSRNNVIAICAAVSPHRASRDEVRRNTSTFVEVHVDCSVATAESRDRDGMYARARRGEIPDFTGVSDVYEAPSAPEVYVNSEVESAESAAWKVVCTLEMLDVLEMARPSTDSDTEALQRRLASLGYV